MCHSAIIIAAVVIIIGLGIALVLSIGTAPMLGRDMPEFDPPPPETKGVSAEEIERSKNIEDYYRREHARALRDAPWRRVLVKDLKVGEVYRDRLSGNRVKVVRTRLFDPEKQRHLRDMADGTMWNAAKGCYQDVHLGDGDLETDDPMLDASEERRIARMAHCSDATWRAREGHSDTSRAAYKMADAMLKSREQ
jgi:hypothetical protein